MRSRLATSSFNGLSDKDLTLLRREKIGFIFQAFNLIPTLTALENIELPMSLAGAKLDRSWIDQVIATVGLGDRIRHRPSELAANNSACGRRPGTCQSTSNHLR
ncbi:MAG: hypothetical protein R2706_05305 [Acidimicrobiales bacterium]